MSSRRDSVALSPATVNPSRPAFEARPLSPLDAIWHLANFFAPALGVGLLSSLMAKLLWRRELKGAPWLRLGAWASLYGALVLVAGLVVFGHDGKMATYGAMVLACAVVLWWVGFRPRRH